MKRAISLTILLSVLGFLYNPAAGSDVGSKYKAYPILYVTGDEPKNPNSKIFSGNIEAVMNMEPYVMTYSDSITQIIDVFTGATSLNDLQSNGVTAHLVQWYKDTLHAVFMSNMTPGLPLVQTRTLYLTSTDMGMTWDYLGQVPQGVISRFPAISLLDDGRAIIGNSSEASGPPILVTLFHDLLPLGGTFTLCDPSGLPSSYVNLTTTASNKVPFICSYGPNPDSLTATNVLTNIVNCSFSGWQQRSYIGELYAIARSQSGKIGIAFIKNSFSIPANAGDIGFVESTDEGLTWGTPVTIWDAQPNPNNYLGALRGIDLVYVGNTPKVVFDLAWRKGQTEYYPGMCSKIMSWSPNVNGGNPVVVVDSTDVPWHTVQGINDMFTPICRGTIGKSRNEQDLFCAYNVARTDFWPPDSTPYFDVYLALSTDGGAAWFYNVKLTNFSGPVKDCRYPSVSPVNDVNFSERIANIEYQRDSIPGSAVNGAPESPAQQHFIRMKLPKPDAIKKQGSEIPRNFALYQNYPNPFNPVTKIEFQIPVSPLNERPTTLRVDRLVEVEKRGFVTLIIYDVLGSEITVLVDEKLGPGKYETEFDGSNFPSGVYFYILQAGDYKETKKMVLIK